MSEGIPQDFDPATARAHWGKGAGMTSEEAMDAVDRRRWAYAYLGTGELFGEGEVIAYSMIPTLTIRRADGSHFTWRRDMVRGERRPLREDSNP